MRWHVTDPSNKLESRLRQLRPRTISRALEERIGVKLVEAPHTLSPSPGIPGHGEGGGAFRGVNTDPLPNRPPEYRGREKIFWSAVVSGAIAACVIVVVFHSESAGPRNVSPSTLTIPNSNPVLTAIARADGRWG